MKAPFPYFGGKSRIAALVWERFGDVVNYVEPFFGSGAVLLARPHAPTIETVNDLDCYVANFWRAIAAAPDEVAALCDWPVNEADLHARHRWLVDRVEFRARMKADPEFFDAKIAAWWCWGLSAWIGSGWCSAASAEDVQDRLPMIGGSGSDDRPNAHRGRGVHALHAKRPALGGREGRPNGGNGTEALSRLPALGGAGGRRDEAQLGRGVHGAGMREQLPHLGAGGHLSASGEGTGATSGRGIHASTHRSRLYPVFAELSARLRNTRVACGDWARIVTDSVTWRHGTTAIFLDPPYSTAGRTKDLYAHDSETIAAEVSAWCAEHGADRRLRIALCGYEGEHNALEALGWAKVSWKAKGGYANQGGENANARAERVWFSPACLRGEEQLLLL